MIMAIGALKFEFEFAGKVWAYVHDSHCKTKPVSCTYNWAIIFLIEIKGLKGHPARMESPETVMSLHGLI
jgi:hypothetical protein